MESLARSLSPSALVVFKCFYQNSHPNNTATTSPPLPVSHPPVNEQSFQTIRALATAPFISTYTGGPSFLVCAEVFFEDNPLLAATLKPATQTRYTVALEKFTESRVANEYTPLSLDQRLSIYIQESYLENPRAGNRQEMSNLICMLLLMYPSLKTDLGLARRCITGWKALKPSQSPAPFTKEILLALVWPMISKGRAESATVLLMSFAACLRISEAINIIWNDLALPGDVRLAAYPPGTAGMNILDAKTSRYTGKLQFVKLTDEHAIKFLTQLNSIRTPRETRLANVSYQRYTSDLHSALSNFGLENGNFSSHSARIGKATEDYIKGESVEQIAINGRWKSLNSLRYYLNNGRAWVLNAPLSVEKQAKISRDANRIKDALRM